MPEGVEVHYVISTWRKRGAKLWGAMSANRMRGLIANNIVDLLPPNWLDLELLDRLPHLREQVSARASAEDITEKRLEESYPGSIARIEEKLNFEWFEKVQFRSGNKSASDPFSLSMLYKIWQADLLRRNLEAHLGYQFDYLIRARPDLPFAFPQYAFLKSLSPEVLYIDRVRHNPNDAGDGLAIGTRATMSVYSDFFFDAYRCAARGEWRHIHVELYDYLNRAGLILKPYPVLDYSPDQLATRDDLRESIRASAVGVNAINSKEDADALIASLDVFADSNLPSRDLIRTRVESIVGDRKLQRDAGFFYYLSGRLRQAGQYSASALSLIIALPAIRTSHVSNTLVQPYLGALFEILQSLFEVTAEALLDKDAFLEKLMLECAAATNEGNAIYFAAANLSTNEQLTQTFEWGLTSLATVPGYWLWFVDQLLAREKWQTASQYLEFGLKAKAQDDFYNAKLAIVAARQQKRSTAADLACRASSSNEAGPLHCAAEAFLLMQEFPKALSCIRRAQVIDPSNPELDLFEGIVHDVSGNSAAAIDCARRAAERTPPPMAHRHNLLGLFYRKGGFTREAKAAFNEAINRAPTWDDVRDQLIQICIMEKSYYEAACLQLDAARYRPDSLPIRIMAIERMKMVSGAEFESLFIRATSIWPDAKAEWFL